MKATNIGIVKAVISKKMSDNFINEGNVDKSKTNAAKFLDIVSNSPILQLEFKVYDRLENQTISNDISATRYIDNNLSLFENYSQEDLDKEHDKIKHFIDETVSLIDTNKYNLYESIGSLIYETLNKNNPDVDLIHESFTVVLSHLKEEKEVKKVEDKVVIPEGVDSERLIGVALNTFSKKYEALGESDISLIKNIVMADEKERKFMFEGLKNENVALLEGTEKNGMEDKIHETIDRIKKMEYKDDSSIKNILSLHQLKSDLG